MSGKSVDLGGRRIIKKVIEAAANGAADGWRLALNVGAMLLAFIALIAMIDYPLNWIGGLVGSNDGWLYFYDPCSASLLRSYPFGAAVGAAVFADTDGDGKPDGAEVAMGGNPTLNEGAVLMTIINYAKMGMRHKDEATRDKALSKILAAAERAAQLEPFAR